MARTCKVALKIVVARDSAQYPQPVADFDLQDSNGNPTNYEFDLNGFFIQRRIVVPVAVTTTYGSKSISLTGVTGLVRRNCLLVNSGPTALYVASFVHAAKAGTSAASNLENWTYAPDSGSEEAGVCIPPGGIFVIPVGYPATIRNASTTDEGLLDIFLAEVDDELLTDLDDNS